MSGWLSRAVAVFGGRPAAEPQPFDVRCPCGGRVAGVRTDSSQLLGCPGCRQMLLVLPATVYPLPARPKPVVPKQGGAASPPAATTTSPESGSGRSLRKRRRGQAPVDEPGQEVSAESGAETSASPAQPSKGTPSPGASSTDSPRPRDAGGAIAGAATGRSSGVPTDRRAERKAANARFAAAVSAWRKRTFTPVRLVVAAVLLCLGGTGYWLRLRQDVLQAERVVTESSRLAEVAVESRSWGEAAELYGQVESALDRLEREDPPARRLRQWSREVRAMTNLLPTTLADLVDEAANGDWEARGLNWSEVFRASHADQWVLVESTLPAVEEATPDSAAGSGVVISVPLLVGPIRATVEGDLPVLAKVPVADRPARVLVAAQIAAVETVDGRWVVRLAGDSAFLWVHPGTLEEIGLLGEGDDLQASRTMLEQQAEWLGVTE